MKAFLLAAGVGSQLADHDTTGAPRCADVCPRAAKCRPESEALWTSDLFRASPVPCFSGRPRTGMSAASSVAPSMRT